jgi:hypothetical protein
VVELEPLVVLMVQRVATQNMVELGAVVIQPLQLMELVDLLYLEVEPVGMVVELLQVE